MLGEPNDLKIVPGHELQRVGQPDVAWEIALEFVRPLFCWNPVRCLWKHQPELMRELGCDRQVVARRGYDVSSTL